VSKPFTFDDIEVHLPDGSTISPLGPMPFETIQGGGRVSAPATLPFSEIGVLGALGPNNNVEGIYNFSFPSPFPNPGRRIPLPEAGTLDRLRIDVDANSLDGASSITVLVNGVDTALSLTYAPAESGAKSLDVAVPVMAGDQVSYRVDTLGSTTGLFGRFSATVEFTP